MCIGQFKRCVHTSHILTVTVLMYRIVEHNVYIQNILTDFSYSNTPLDSCS